MRKDSRIMYIKTHYEIFKHDYQHSFNRKLKKIEKVILLNLLNINFRKRHTHYEKFLYEL